MTDVLSSSIAAHLCSRSPFMIGSHFGREAHLVWIGPCARLQHTIWSAVGMKQ
jgi:hypothetical protein